MSEAECRAIAAKAIKSGDLKIPVKVMDDDQRKAYYREYHRNMMRKCRAKRYAIGLTSSGLKRTNRNPRSLCYSPICGL